MIPTPNRGYGRLTRADSGKPALLSNGGKQARRLLIAAAAISLLLAGCAGPEQESVPSEGPPSSYAPPASPQHTATAAPGQPLAVVMNVVVAPRRPGLPKYDRDDWKHWTDVDGDCQDTRHEVLISESSVAVTFADDRSCRVATGRWTGPYTGEVVEDPGKLDVDHMVPLANAHVSGAHEWSAERKELYANSLSYPGHLIATTASANRSKGRKGPEEWRPPDRTYWCRYAMDWAAIKREWGLTATEAEAGALREMLGGCEPSVHLQLTHAETTTPGAASPSPAPEATAPAVTPTPAQFDTQYDPDGPDRDCGDFDAWADAQAFYRAAGGPEADPHRLDSDEDGVACGSLPGAPESAAPTAEPTSTPAAAPTSQPSPTPTPTPTSTPTATPTATSTPEPATPTQAPTPTPPPVGTPRPSPTPTPMPTSTPTPTPTATSTPEPDTPTPTHTPEPTATQTPTPGTVELKYDPAGPDRNCSDFDTWAEAQAFYEAAGGPETDRHRLDRDRNGVACESLAGAPSPNTATRAPASPTPRPSPRATPTRAAATATPRPRPTSTPAPATATPRPRSTSTPVPATATPTATQTATPTPGAPIPTPAATPTSGTPTATPTATPTPGTPTATPTATPTPGTPTATPTATPTPGTASPDRNCSDFDTWAEAQAFFEAEGGPESDPHRLDHDGDGIACESLPGAPDQATPTPESRAPTPTPGTGYDPEGPDRNCSDFDTWAEAQAFYEAAGGPESDPHGLDRDRNGIACESLPGAP